MRLCLFTLALVAAVPAAFAQINVAASANGGVATQSSLWTGGATADKANDGNRDGRWSSNSVMHTNNEPGAWWNVSFTNANLIQSINVWNRIELQERLNPFNVTLSLGGSVVWSSTNNNFTDNIVDGDPNTVGMNFMTGGVLADSLRVQLVNSNYLHLAEVEAFNAVPEPATMAALGLGVAALLRRSRKSNA